MPPPQRKPVDSSRAGPGQFPQRWNLYQPGWTRKFQIGTHQDSPVFCVTPHMGWFGKARIKLHADAHKKSAVVAMVKKPVWTMHNRNGFKIIFPSSADGGKEKDIVELRSPFSVGQLIQAHRAYQFSAPTAGGRAETFEWRHTHSGQVIGALREGKDDGWLHTAANRVMGAWELVRLDGREEKVACWADAGISMHKKVAFAFLGAGASGQLGERFATLAVITALALWDEEQRQNAQKQAASNSDI